MIRWVFKLDYDTRRSFLYVIANQASVQVLAQKAVFRFFDSLEKYPRFASTFVQKITQGIEPELLGMSTLTWWKQVQFHIGNIENTKPFYNLFRVCITQDLRESHRVSVTGLDHLLCDVAKHCFAGEPCQPPAKARDILSLLIHPDHSLCHINIKNKQILFL